MKKETTNISENTEVKQFTRFCPVLNLIVTVDFTQWSGLYEREEKCAELIEKKENWENIYKDVIYS